MNQNDPHTPHGADQEPRSPGDSAFRRARFDEGDVASFVEGELEASRLVEFHAALERHPEARAMVDAMRVQRDGLRAMPDEPAPRDLMARVGESLRAEDEPVTIVRQPKVVRVGPSPLRLLFESKATFQFAAAAGLLLVVGVGIMMIARVVERTPLGDTTADFGSPMAMNSTADAKPIDEEADSQDVLKKTIDVLAQRIEPSTEAEDEPALTHTEPITPERAAELALEGRLVLRVVAEHSATARTIAEIAERSDGSGTWRIRADVPPAIVVALAPAATTPTRGERPSPILADDNGRAHEPLVDKTPGFEFEIETIPPDVYLLESAATPVALAGALDALGDRANATVEFVELDEPIETPDVVSVDAILWWNTPTDEWESRVAVPVVVERND